MKILTSLNRPLIFFLVLATAIFYSCSLVQKKPILLEQVEKTEIIVVKRTKNFSNSEMVKIRGKAFINETGELAVGGIITANSENGDYINNEGSFEFEVPEGELIILAKFLGFHNGNLILSAKPGELIELEIRFGSYTVLLDE